MDQVKSGDVRIPRSRSQTVLAVLAFKVRLTYLELSSKFLRCFYKANASASELIVQKILVSSAKVAIFELRTEFDR